MEQTTIKFMEQRVDSDADAIECLRRYIATLSDRVAIDKLTKVLRRFEDLELISGCGN